jgi:hypothetical protein
VVVMVVVVMEAGIEVFTKAFVVIICLPVSWEKMFPGCLLFFPIHPRKALEN